MAGVLGVSKERLRHLVEKGLPRAARGLYPLCAGVQWYVRYKVDLATPVKSRDRAEEARVTVLEAKALQITGHMVLKADVTDACDTAFLTLGKAFESLPAQLGRDCHLPPDAVRKLRARLDTFRLNFARDLSAFLSKKKEGANGKTAKRA